ncbi:uncharacterized protein LOC105389798 [Plutella xylostella]|uniref:uncharacterized protein LOC105389798 n=1 Tax=Plutella xylostella TaxID=51655 RepID=UPI0020325161|nr:uncharacterized protein LOC105389798 [Plutella xylostella]
MRRTGGGPSDPTPPFSEIEQRMVAVMGGEEFATGDQHLSVNPFPAQETARCHTPIEVPEMAEILVIVEADPELPDVQASEPTINVETEVEVPPRSAHPPPTVERPRRRRTQVDTEVDRMASIEEKRVEAELLTARAMQSIASAIRDGAALIASALNNYNNRQH